MKWPYDLIDWEWDEMGKWGNLQDAVKVCFGDRVLNRWSGIIRARAG